MGTAGPFPRCSLPQPQGEGTPGGTAGPLPRCSLPQPQGEGIPVRLLRVVRPTAPQRQRVCRVRPGYETVTVSPLGFGLVQALVSTLA